VTSEAFAIELPGDTVLDLYPLTFLEEGEAEDEEVTVGCAEADSYAVLPADGAALLRQLAAGLSLDQAAEWYQDTYGEPADIPGFAQAVTELGFLRPDGADGLAPGGGARTGSGPVRWQRLGRAVFSPVS